MRAQRQFESGRVSGAGREGGRDTGRGEEWGEWGDDGVGGRGSAVAVKGEGCRAVSAVLVSSPPWCVSKKAFITLSSPVVPLLSTSKADSGLASEFRWDRAIYTTYERMLQ